jgi:hypothetical protein
MDGDGGCMVMCVYLLPNCIFYVTITLKMVVAANSVLLISYHNWELGKKVFPKVGKMPVEP